jgi:hypothetical protein
VKPLGSTTANFGAGITVASLTVNSATAATAVLNIDPAATTGADRHPNHGKRNRHSDQRLYGDRDCLRSSAFWAGELVARGWEL